MDLKLKSRTALVTGSSMGIGRAIAEALAAECSRVAIVARRESLLKALSETIAATGAAAPLIIVADLMDPQAPERIAKAAASELGHVDILVNCAGGSRPFTLDATDGDWEEAMTLNFTRLRQLTQAVLSGMIRQKWGRIINITGKSEPERVNGANAAKAAVHVWAKGLSREVGKHGVTINSLAPGYILSEQIREKFSEEQRAHLAEHAIPVGGIGVPEDIAALVTFLASPLARYITGTIIPVDGGLRRHAF